MLEADGSQATHRMMVSLTFGARDAFSEAFDRGFAMRGAIPYATRKLTRRLWPLGQSASSRRPIWPLAHNQRAPKPEWPRVHVAQRGFRAALMHAHWA